MDINVITQLIGSFGFPIMVAIACFWYINKQMEQHKAEIDTMAEGVNNNTLVLQKLLDKWENG